MEANAKGTQWMTNDVIDAENNILELIDDLRDNEVIKQFKWNETEDLAAKEFCKEVNHAKLNMGGQL